MYIPAINFSLACNCSTASSAIVVDVVRVRSFSLLFLATISFSSDPPIKEHFYLLTILPFFSCCFTNLILSYFFIQIQPCKLLNKTYMYEYLSWMNIYINTKDRQFFDTIIIKYKNDIHIYMYYKIIHT